MHASVHSGLHWHDVLQYTVLSRWVTMDFSTPPPVYSASQRVYVLRMKDGTHAALRLVSYMSDRGTKGYLTIDVKYPY